MKNVPRFKKIKELSFTNIILVIFVIILVVYWGTWDGFFQQDEWAGLGNFYFLQSLPIIERLKALYTPIFKQGMGHFLPWIPAVNYVRYYFYDLNYMPYAIVAILLHVVASFSVFQLALQLCKDRRSAFGAALFFAVASSASQTVIWVGTSLPTQLALIFSVISIICWFDWLNNQKSKNIWLSVCFLILAVGFKETALFLFLLLPVIGFLYKPQLKRKFLTVFGFIGFGYFLLRFGALVATFGVRSSIVQTLLLFRSAIFRFVSVVLTGTTQTILPQELVLTFAGRITQSRGDPVYDMFFSNQILRPIIYVLGLLLFVTFVLYAKKQKAKDRRALMFPFLWYVLTFVPLSFLPTGELDAIFLAPRGLYLPIAAIAVLFASILKRPIEKKSKALILFILLLLIHIFVLRTQINGFTKTGAVRKAILQQIKTEYPNLPDKVIFYTESDKSHYGLPEDETILPFQSGFGQTLLVWYQEVGQFPAEFFQNRFLWEIKSQGYKEVEGKGFGYFRNFDLMAQTMENEEISEDSIIAFRYDSQTKLLEDITEEIHGRASGYLVKKRQLISYDFSLSASENNKEVLSMLDGNRDTFWESELPYKEQQYFRIHLQNRKMIAQVRIDSYNNKDQNNVGYSISLSDNGENWNEVFYSKRYLPEEDGFVDLYFEPQDSRYIEIRQVGFHEFAPWVVHELEIYEAIN